MEYDGVAEVWVDSLEDWKAIVADTEFVKAVAGMSVYSLSNSVGIREISY